MDFEQGKLTGKFLFVEHAKGEMNIDSAVVPYDNVQLSDGLATFKVKNLTGEKKFELEKGAEVNCDFSVRLKNTKFGQQVVLDLVSLSVA